MKRLLTALLALAWPASAGALSGSKLGPHSLGDAGDGAALAILDACPRVAKWLAGSGELGAIRRYREKCPGGQVVIRGRRPRAAEPQ